MEAKITDRLRNGVLAGIISEKLLRCKLFNVFAIRVVNPGLLGNPGDLIFPLAGHPRGFKAAMPFFLMLVPSVHKLIVLRIMYVNPLRFRYMSAAAAAKLLGKGDTYPDRCATQQIDSSGSLGPQPALTFCLRKRLGTDS